MPEDTPRSKPRADMTLADRLKEIDALIDAWNLVGAEARLDMIPRNQRKDALYYRVRGRLLLGMNKLDEAVKWLKKSLDLVDTDPATHLYLANTYSAMQQPHRAAEVLEQACDKCDDAMELYSRLETLYHEMGRKERALAVVEMVKRRYAGKPELDFKMAEAAQAIGLFSNAIDRYRQCIDKNYVGPNMYHRLAQCFGRCSQREAAAYFFQRALVADGFTAALLNEVQEYMMFAAGSGNEKLLSALAWKVSKVRDTSFELAQVKLLDFPEEDLEAYLEDWLEQLDTDEDYLYFCEFYKNLIFHKHDHSSFDFKPKESLHASIGGLRNAGYETLTSYYEAWLALAEGSVEKAKTMFRLVSQTRFADPMIQRGLSNAYEVITERESSRELTSDAPGQGYVQSLSRRLAKLKNPPAWGTDDLVDRMMDALAFGPNRSIILSGPSGVGKTTAVVQLAWRLAQKKCPDALREFEIQQTSTSMLLSGAKYIGTWQERVLELCSLSSIARRKIIYFEDIHNTASAGSVMEDRTRFLDVLLPYMERGEIAVIGELLPQQAQQTLGREPQLKRLVKEIALEEPTTADLVDIVRHSADLQTRTGIAKIDDTSIQEAITLSQVFTPYKAFPGKAIDLMAGAIRSVAEEHRDEPVPVNDTTVMKYFCKSTGVPEAIVDTRVKLHQKDMLRFFKERILGQDHALAVLMDAVTVFKGRLSDPRTPIRSFLFVGPTGVGKTEAARVLGEYLFGSADRLIRLHMSEYNSPASVSRLLATRSGRDSAGTSFLEQLRARPFSVVLLDEVEKADPAVLNLFLQMLDEGEICDEDGKPVYFQSSIVIMTSNLGARRYSAQSIGFDAGLDTEGIKKAVLADVAEFFAPEILNRFDGVISFKPLHRDVLETIVNREIGKVLTRRGVLDHNLDVDVDPQVIEHILKTGYDLKYGARHIKRAVEACVAVPLAVATSSQSVEEGDLVRINMRSGAPVADVVRVSTVAVKVREVDSSGDGHRFDGLPDKDLRKSLESMGSRIQSLKQKLDYDNLHEEYITLKDEMSTPSFWDRPSDTKPKLQRYAEINRIIERVEKWERLLDNVGQTLQAQRRTQIRGRKPKRVPLLSGLLMDLESAEMETLLDGPHDAADAFLIVQSRKSGAEELEWMLTLADIYAKWSRRRGFDCKVIGEQHASRAATDQVLLHIGGMNAYGLLKNEQGLHRQKLPFTAKDGTAAKRMKQHFISAHVTVFPDIDVRDPQLPDPTVTIKRVAPEIRGWKTRSLSRQITLGHRSSAATLTFLTGKDLLDDRNLLSDLFKSYAYFMQHLAAGEHDDRQDAWGSVVRTVSTQPKPRVEDHRSGMVMTDMRKFLAGNIDPLLLERLV